MPTALRVTAVKPFVALAVNAGDGPPATRACARAVPAAPAAPVAPVSPFGPAGICPGAKSTASSEWSVTFDEPTGRIQIDPDGRGAVSRADVAAVIAATLHEPCTVGRTIRFGNGDTDAAVPIAEALSC